MPKPQIPFHCNVIILPSSFPQSQLSQSGHSHQILMDVVANCNLYHDIIGSHLHLNFNFTRMVLHVGIYCVWSKCSDTSWLWDWITNSGWLLPHIAQIIVSYCLKLSPFHLTISLAVCRGGDYKFMGCCEDKGYHCAGVLCIYSFSVTLANYPWQRFKKNNLPIIFFLWF